MAVQTPITNSTFFGVDGELRRNIYKFASVANNDTFPTGMAYIAGISAESGNTATVGATWSGGTVTFVIGSGPATNVPMTVWGY
jgi:hypothetical protein